jgi:DNA-binding CsgD family transcriptional regulator
MVELVGAPMVGRAAELGELDAAFAAALGGRFGVVLVRGEPGIGKTRLVEELARSAAQRAVVAWGRVDEDEGAPPYWPWTQLLGAVLAAADPEAAAAAVGDDAATLARILPQLAQAGAAAPADRDPVAARFQLHQAVTGVLRRLSTGRCLLLILDDLHWADAESLQLTRFVARHLDGAPVLLVATYRTVDAGGSSAFDDLLGALARAPDVVQVGVGGLSEPEVGEFIVQTLDAAGSGETVGFVHARTEGNPFYVGELVRLMASETLRGPSAAGPQEVPVGVRDVLRRRVARLPPASRELLLLGSVLGREIELRVLAQVARTSELAALDQLGAAIDAGFLLEDPAAIGRLRFAHALTRDTVYGELSPLRRATLHAGVAEALEQHEGDSAARLIERAEHFARAASVLGPERGVHYALRAAEQAQAALAHEQAEDLLRRALGLIELMPAGSQRIEQELHAQNRLAALLIATRGHTDPEVGRICTRARALSAQAGPSPEMVITLAKLVSFHLVNGDLEICAELGAQLLAIGEQQDDVLARALGGFCEGFTQPYFNDLPRAQAALARAVEYARQLPLTHELTAAMGGHLLPLTLGYQARYAGLAGDRALCEAAGAEATQVAQRSGHAYSIAYAAMMRLTTGVLMADDPAWVAQHAASAGSVSADGGFALVGAWCSIFHGWALCELGELDRGLKQLDAGLRGHREANATLNTVLFLALSCDARRRAGEDAAALALIDEALAVAATNADRIYEADLHRRRGELLADAGPEHRATAIAALNTAVGIARAQGMVLFEHRALAALARVAPQAQADAEPTVSLSPRERDLLRLLASGMTDKEIAAALVISVRTVGSHLDRIRDKTGRRRRPDLTRLALELGLEG